MNDGSSLKSSSDEKNLLRRTDQGELERFADLISRYQPHVSRIISRRVPTDQVKEVVHDVFVRACFSLARYSGWGAFDHWLAGIAVRTRYDFWRVKKRDEIPVRVLADEHHCWIDRMLTAQSDDQFRDHAQKREAVEVLESVLEQLWPEHRAVLTLVHLEGRSVRDKGSCT